MSRCISSCSLLAPKTEPAVRRSIAVAKRGVVRICVSIVADFNTGGLLASREVSPPVPLPAPLGGFGTNRPFFAVADGLELVRGHAQLHKEVAGRTGAAV